MLTKRSNTARIALANCYKTIRALIPADTPAEPAQVTVQEADRETVVETITEIIGETHDIDVQDHHYAEAIVRWLEQNRPAEFRAIAGGNDE